jgi:hypothetical protein
LFKSLSKEKCLFADELADHFLFLDSTEIVTIKNAFGVKSQIFFRFTTDFLDFYHKEKVFAELPFMNILSSLFRKGAFGVGNF